VIFVRRDPEAHARSVMEYVDLFLAPGTVGRMWPISSTLVKHAAAAQDTWFRTLLPSLAEFRCVVGDTCDK
jgi:hypothetical protein